MFVTTSNQNKTVRKYQLIKPKDSQLTQQEIESFLNTLYLEQRLHNNEICRSYNVTNDSIEVVFMEGHQKGSLDTHKVFLDIIRLLFIPPFTSKKSKINFCEELSNIIRSKVQSSEPEHRSPGFMG